MDVIVVPHDPRWTRAFRAEASAINAAIGAVPIVLHHIGSTAIPGILAKPVIDLMGEVRDLADVDAHGRAFEALGYETMGAYGIAGRRYFRRRDGDGRQTHHLHVYEAASPHVERHLAFRDYLQAHPAVAAEYSDLKARLIVCEPTREDYQDGKDPFVRRTELAALEWHRSRG